MAERKHKDWFDRELAIDLADKMGQYVPSFNAKAYVDQVEQTIAPLELKDRIEVFTDAFHDQLPGSIPDKMLALTYILGPENQEETGMFKNFYWIMPIAKYVEKYGLNHWDESMTAIEEITKRNTSEYAIRPFLEQHFDKTYSRMLMWSRDDNFHIRRLSCEGLRPRLPWARKLEKVIDQPALLKPVLDQLQNDPIQYVQKSVANCLNDIIKDNLDYAKDIINEWCTDPMTPQRSWIVKHALRKLRKNEDPWAIELTGRLS